MGKILPLIYVLILIQPLRAQHSLSIHWKDNKPDPLKQENFQEEFRDSLSLVKAALQIREDLYKHGFLLSQGNLVWLNDSTARLHIKSGKPYFWGSITLASDDGNLPEIYTRPPDKKNADEAALLKFTDQWLTYYENNGYPFSTLSFTDYDAKNDTINGTLLLQKGPLIKIDSIVVKGYEGFPYSLLRYELGLEKGMPYSEAFLNNLGQRIQMIEYLNFSRSPAMAFSRSKNILYLYLQEVKSNEIDGIIGLNTKENGELSFNGNFILRLLNSLKKGEEIALNWQRPDDNISNLELKLSYPYLFRLPFVTSVELGIFRQDTSFVNSRAGGGIKLILGRANFLSAGVNYRSSNVLTSGDDPSSSIQAFKTTSYKLGYERYGTDRRIVPRRGNIFISSVNSGVRNTADANTRQYGWDIYDAQYWPLGKYHIVKTAIRSEALFGENLFDNELFRIGGLKSLRGFNEKSIFASAYGTTTLEYRYMLGDYDYFTLFGDLAYVRRQNSGLPAENWLLGLGGGINIRTNAGIFSLFYALGRTDNTPFNFKTSKIHFGYINRF